MPVVLQTPESRADIVEILFYIRRESVAGARRVHAAMDETLRLLAEYPNAGREREELAPRLRSLPVRGYRNFLVFYRVIPNGVEVIRVLHGARNLRRIFRKR